MNWTVIARGALVIFGVGGAAAVPLTMRARVPSGPEFSGETAESLGPQTTRAQGPVVPAAPLVEQNPFRSNRTPSAAVYGSQDSGPPPAPEPPPREPLPDLRLVGIVFSGAPTAVIRGLPGTSGPVVVGVGDEYGAIRIELIDKESVRVMTMDTTWTLNWSDS